MSAQSACDVAIIGAGPAGASLAIALSRAGYDTVLMHRPERDLCFFGGVHETLGGAVTPALQALGLWDAFSRTSPQPAMGTVAHWGDGGAAERPAFFTAFGAGWHVARPAFDGFLRGEASQAGAHVRLFDGVEGITRTGEGGWRLRCRGAAELSAGFVVDASGRRRVLARRLGARSQRQDDLIALMGHVRAGEQAEKGKLLIKADHCGWWYALPSADGQFTVALMTDPQTARSGGLGNAEQWHAALRQTCLIGPKIQFADMPGKVRRRLAGASRAMPSGGEAWLAVGDAATSLDPLAGRGLTQAIWDGLRGAEAISRWLNGETGALRHHVRMQTEVFDHHIQQKQAYYRLVANWPDERFWRNRFGYQTVEPLAG